MSHIQEKVRARMLLGKAQKEMVAHIYDNNVAGVASALESLPQLLNEYEWGRVDTPLTKATRLGRIDIVKHLIDAGADVNKPMRSYDGYPGMTPVNIILSEVAHYYASISGRALEILLLLHAAGAPVTVAEVKYLIQHKPAAAAEVIKANKESAYLTVEGGDYTQEELAFINRYTRSLNLYQVRKAIAEQVSLPYVNAPHKRGSVLSPRQITTVMEMADYFKRGPPADWQKRQWSQEREKTAKGAAAAAGGGGGKSKSRSKSRSRSKSQGGGSRKTRRA